MEQQKQGRSGKRIDICQYNVGLWHQMLANTLRFMWFSTEGVQFPDETGRIKRELERPAPDLRVINQELWDQALIIPYGHDTEGVWARPGIDVSRLNLALGALDFSLVRWAGD